MSDSEYEYDDESMEDEQQEFEYTDEEEEPDSAEVQLENAYYNAKGLRDSNDVQQAVDAFNDVVQQETAAESKMGPWSFKALKQLCKLHLRAAAWEAVLPAYQRLLECVQQGNVSPNAVEKGLQAMLERVASLCQPGSSTGSTTANSSAALTPTKSPSTATRMDESPSTTQSMDPAQALALQVYDATLQIFHPTRGTCPNERLWFKTNIKYGQLLYETQQTSKLQAVLKELQAVQQKTATDNEGGSSSSASTNSMEIFALQIQLYSQTRDHKRLRATYQQAMQIRGGIPHPRTLALIQELGGKMQLAAKEYDAACQTFFQAFKSYDEAGDVSRLRCLNYLVLAGMLGRSNINPFDSQECRPYKDDPSVVAMTNLVAAFHDNDIVAFEKILKQPKGQRLLADTFLRQHVADLLETIRRQVLHRLVQPYSRITLQALADALNHMAVADLEALLVRLIVDGTLANARIDRTQGVLVRIIADTSTNAENEEIEALARLLGLVNQVGEQVANVRVKETSTMSMMNIGGSAAAVGGMAAFRGMVHS